jgi:putative transposase
MGTSKRRSYHEPGHAHELTFSCYHGFKFLSADRTCQWLAEAIEGMRATLDVALWAYVFMPEHVHLVVYPRGPRYEISEILKRIKEPVGRRAIGFLKDPAPGWLDRVTQRRGRRTERLFWQSGGGYDRNITEPRALNAMIASIHQNPVRRGLVARARDWHWSSAAWFEGLGSSGLVPDPIPPEWAD